MAKTLDAIVKQTIDAEGLSRADANNLQQQWDRQFATADAIIAKQDDCPTILLADEVGMGKTYVALAVMSHHIFQTNKNNKKVLLVVPPNNVLRSKWEQEIRSFNEKYLLDVLKLKKRLRPLVIQDYWELIENLHDYSDCDLSRISEEMLQCFAFAVSQWKNSRKQKWKWRVEWKAAEGLFDGSPEYLGFRATYSIKALYEYLNGKYASNRSVIDELFESLDKGEDCSGQLKEWFREFGRQQDSFEPNVFIIGMASLRKTKISAGESRLFNTFISNLLLKGRWETKKNRAYDLLDKSEIIISRKSRKRKEGYYEWVGQVGASNLWGMKKNVEEVISARSDCDTIVQKILNGDKVNGIFKEIQDAAIRQKLQESGITLAIVDEVHNWKNGSNGAETFENQYAPFIPKKLIMSATPFQIHQDELGKVFQFASGGGPSMQVIENILREAGEANACIEASADFLKHWKMLTKDDMVCLFEMTETPKTGQCDSLKDLSAPPGASDALNSFVQSIHRYKISITALCKELSKVLVRHTKSRDKRHFHAGLEYALKNIPDYNKVRRSLYTVNGLGDENSAFINFLAMRADQMVRRDMQSKGYEENAHLLGGITSSNGAFRESNKKLLENKSISGGTKRYLDFFSKRLSMQLHPKVLATSTRAFDNFCRGQKTLIYCERLKTLDEIEQTISVMIDKNIFQKGGFENSKKIRKEILEKYQVVELYWSRSYLTAKTETVRNEILQALDAQAEDCLLQAKTVAAGLSIIPNERQSAKLLDLCLIKQIVSFEKKHALPVLKTAEVMADFISNEDEIVSESLRIYLRNKKIPIGESIDDDYLTETNNRSENAASRADITVILDGASIWFASKQNDAFHNNLWKLMESELKILAKPNEIPSYSAFAAMLLDIPQGLRKLLLRLDFIMLLGVESGDALTNSIVNALDQVSVTKSADSINEPIATPWGKTSQFLQVLLQSEGTINRLVFESSKRQSLWKGVFLRNEAIVKFLNGDVDQDTRVNLCAAFNSSLLPDILVCTAIGSEGIDLHTHCAEVIHHDLPWNPAKIEQRTGRVDRVGSLVEAIGDYKHFRLNIGIPFLSHNYEKFKYDLVHSRAQKFEILLGKPDFPIDVADEDRVDASGNEVKVEEAQDDEKDTHTDTVACLPDELIKYLEIDLSVYPKAKEAVIIA